MNIEPFLTFFQCQELEYEPLPYKWYGHCGHSIHKDLIGERARFINQVSILKINNSLVPDRAILINEDGLFGWNDQ